VIHKFSGKGKQIEWLILKGLRLTNLMANAVGGHLLNEFQKLSSRANSYTSTSAAFFLKENSKFQIFI
jgi:hypothetical protein